MAPPFPWGRSSFPRRAAGTTRRYRSTGKECKCARRLTSPAGHGGEDHEDVAVADLGLEPLEDADVLVVEVHVDVAVEVAGLAEDLLLRGGVLGGQRVEDLADGRTVGRDLLLAARRGPEDRRDLHGCHRSSEATQRRRRTPRSPGRRPSPRRRSPRASASRSGTRGRGGP